MADEVEKCCPTARAGIVVILVPSRAWRTVRRRTGGRRTATRTLTRCLRTKREKGAWKRQDADAAGGRPRKYVVVFILKFIILRLLLLTCPPQARPLPARPPPARPTPAPPARPPLARPPPALWHVLLRHVLLPVLLLRLRQASPPPLPPVTRPPCPRPFLRAADRAVDGAAVDGRRTATRTPNAA